MIDINTQEIELKELNAYENNPRINEKAVKYFVNSIKNFGFLVPIVIDKDNVIICGHTRYLASKELNLKTVPCIRAENLTDKQIKAFRIADNKIHEKSNWDDELLKDELIELKNFGFNLEELGFLDFELDYIFGKEVDIDSLFTEHESEKTKKGKRLFAQLVDMNLHHENIYCRHIYV